MVGLILVRVNIFKCSVSECVDRPIGYTDPITEVSSPTLSSGAQQKFDSLSPGDVESISEGEIPETEADLETETPVVVPKLEQSQSDGNVSEFAESALDDTPDTPVVPDKETGDQKAQPPTPPITPILAVTTASPVKVEPSPLILPSTPPSLTLPINAETLADSPVPQDEPTMDVEPFEPILSDEEIVDEADTQVSNI